MDTITSNFLKQSNIPDAVSLRILDFSRPTSIPETYKKEIELMGTFKAFKHLSLDCDKQWGKYYKAWNRRNTPGNIPSDEPDLYPPHMWSLIEHNLIKNDKTTAQHYLHNLEIVRDSPELLEKFSNYERVMWSYRSETNNYERVRKIYRARETMKDLVSYIDCLRTCIDHIERAEHQQAFRAQFATQEDYEDYLIDQENQQFLEQISTHEGYMEWRYG